MVRGCGRRVPGGTYLVCSTSPFGLPVEYFVVDPDDPHSSKGNIRKLH